MQQLCSPADDTAEADSSLNTETTDHYVWVSGMINFYFCASTNDVAWPEALCFRLFVRACIPSVVNTIARKLLDIFSPNFQLRCILGQG